ncbi:MAG TPA: CotH kinase family protein, partial [Roseateles sp.]
PTGTAQAFVQLEISTNNAAPIANREDYVKGTFKLSGAGVAAAEGGLEIRGRGNSTWDWPKKPYRIKLTNATALAGMPASRHWVLLANYADKTLLRNDMAFTLSRQMGMAYTVRDQIVELTLNGQYQGLYQLAEHIRVAKDRVDIPELKATDTGSDKISGGYLIEVDFRMHRDYCKDPLTASFSSFCVNGVNTQRDTQYCVDSAHSSPFCVKEPEDLFKPEWAAHRAYLETFFADAEAALFGPGFKDPATGYAKYIDVDSVIDYWLINEFSKNVDGAVASFFMTKKRDGKLHFGPIWDMDLAFGNAGYNDADKTAGWHLRRFPWFARLFEDPAFAQRAKARYAALKAEGKFELLLQYAQARATWMTLGQQRNFALWPIFDWATWYTRVLTPGYDAEVKEMLRWQRERLAWMDAELSQ